MNNNSGKISTVLLIIMIGIVSIWNNILLNFYYGLLGFKIIITFALFKCIVSIIHNIHYDKFISLDNPFFLLLLFGGYYLIHKHDSKLNISIIRGFDWFEWFTESDEFTEKDSVTRQIISSIFFLISLTPYFIFIRLFIIKIKYKKENAND